MIESKKIGIISLGCDKNRVDTEKMIAKIKEQHQIVCNIEDAQIIVINTCAFLKTAREEAIEEILYSANLKKEGNVEKIIVTGCLPQKFIKDIYQELQEVDAFLGVCDYGKINEVIEQIYKNCRVNAVNYSVDKLINENLTKRTVSTDNYAYLKIADGCYNHCTFCLIPKIRGNYRSVKIEQLIKEAKSLGKVSELILVAQDCTRYGEDLFPKSSLVELIQKLSRLKNVGGIRLLYCYPEAITDQLIEEIKNNDKVIKYIDIPFQHGDDKILKLMGRRGNINNYLQLIEKLKNAVPEIAIRSTFMVGFPTEDEMAFNNLVEFIKKAKLRNAGFFKYSREEGTPAYQLKEQVKAVDKQKRLRKIYSVQKNIIKEFNKTLIGKTYKVLAEGFDKDRLVYYGRAYFNAPDIDGKVYFFSPKQIDFGKTYNIKITDFSDYDLIGERLWTHLIN